LNQVDEVNGASTYTTSYEYNYLDNLTKVTDALSNIRNFTYDGLGRRKTAEDLHASADSYFGTWTYTYDDAGNITTRLSPESETTNFTYDDTNRVLTEDYTGDAGTEVSYAYDSCPNGKGYLCSATTTDAVTSFEYNALGLVEDETRTIDSTSYITTYDYDRQGNITTMTYPDNAQVKYTYNTAGLVETVQHKEESDPSFTTIVTDLDYGPHGKVTFQSNYNSTETTNTYDSTQLYRLINKTTTTTDEFYYIALFLDALEDPSSPLHDLAITLLTDEDPSQDAVTNDETLTETPSDTTRNRSSQTPRRTPPTRQDNTTDTSNETTEEPTPETTPTDESTAGESTEGAASNTLISETNLTNEPTTEILIEDTTEDSLLTSTTTDSSTTSIEEELFNKSAKNKAAIKGQAIAELQNVPKEKRTSKHFNGYIEVVDLKARDNGVEAFVRAWGRNNKQIGFGTDGSVDIERFIIINPPILVSDPHGDIIRTNINFITGEEETEIYREDLKEALLQVLEHTIKVKEQKFDDTNIVKGKVGSTTTTVYPDAHPESTTVDGVVWDAGNNVTWANLIAEPGNAANDNNTSAVYIYIESTATTNQWKELDRAIFLFDTSSIPDTDTIDSATLSIYGTAKVDNLSITPDINVYSAAPASDTALVSGDFDSFGSTAYASALSYASLDASDYNDLSFNASGKSAVDKTDVSKFGVRNANYDVAESAPTWSSSSYSYFGGYYADQSGTTQDPKLVVEHSVPTYAPTAPTDLETEGEYNPNRVTDTTPEFSAIYRDPDAGDQAINYQLQVSTTSGDFTSPLWDSSKTSMTTTTVDTRSPEISYGGDPLSFDGSTYYWRIKFWDDEDQEGSWSTTTASFTMKIEGGIQNLTYTYDNVGNITQIDDTSDNNGAKTIDFTYDDLYRLLTASTTDAVSGGDYLRTYTYNEIGNITNKSDLGYYVYDGDEGTSYANPHAVTDMASSTYTYDKNGNLTGDGTWTFTWDYNNRLTNADNGTASTTYGYDYGGQRVKLDNGSDITYYPNRYYNIEGSTTTRHIWAGDTLISTIIATSTGTSTYMIHTDHLGGVHVKTDKDGVGREAVDYYPFGDIRVQQGSQDDQRKFTGHHYDEDTSLLYMGARYYPGNVGRFISQDPLAMTAPVSLLVDPQSLNTYTYARNNPLILIDPTGLFNQETGEIEEGDAPQDIVSGVNEKWETNYSWVDIVTLNPNIQGTTFGATIGRTIIPNASVPDITVNLTQRMHMNAQTMRRVGKLLVDGWSMFYFANKVRPGGDWDFKRNDDEDIPYFNPSHDQRYVFRGINIRWDAPGNIHYGYVGMAANETWSTPGILHMWAGRFQEGSPKITNKYGDDWYDSIAISWGISLYQAGE
jgi:RHS repeat-associated protein